MGTQQTGNEGQPAVSLRGLRKGFGEVTAVAGIDLDIADGEFFSMLGPSGSGKTTVLRLVAGFESPTAGTVSLKGRDVTRLAPFERDVTTVFQDYALFPHMSVLDNVAYGLRVRRTPRSRRRDMAATALDTVRLSGMESRRPHQLSGGQRQRVALARALVVDPAVLLLDEPLGALDLKLREQMQVELKEIQRRVGITFVFVTHDQEEALTMSDRIAVFRHGAIEQVGTPAEVYERPRTQFVAAFVGTSNLITGDAARRILGRDGAYNVRPEKIQLTTDVEQKPTDDEAFVVGRVTEVSYAGVVTRFVVDVDGGPRMVAVQQNATVSSTQVHALRGRMVRLSWDRRHSFAIEGSLENDLLEEAR